MLPRKQPCTGAVLEPSRQTARPSLQAAPASSLSSLTPSVLPRETACSRQAPCTSLQPPAASIEFQTVHPETHEGQSLCKSKWHSSSCGERALQPDGHDEGLCSSPQRVDLAMQSTCFRSVRPRIKHQQDTDRAKGQHQQIPQHEVTATQRTSTALHCQSHHMPPSQQPAIAGIADLRFPAAQNTPLQRRAHVPDSFSSLQQYTSTWQAAVAEEINLRQVPSGLAGCTMPAKHTCRQVAGQVLLRPMGQMPVNCFCHACRIAEVASLFHAAVNKAQLPACRDPTTGTTMPDLQGKLRPCRIMYYSDCEMQAFTGRASKAGGLSEGSKPDAVLLLLRSGHEKSGSYRYVL